MNYSRPPRAMPPVEIIKAKGYIIHKGKAYRKLKLNRDVNYKNHPRPHLK